jgi:hypothetical protein
VPDSIAMATIRGVQPSRRRGRENVSWLVILRTTGIERIKRSATRKGRVGKEAGAEVVALVEDSTRRGSRAIVVVFCGLEAGGDATWGRPDV